MTRTLSKILTIAILPFLLMAFSFGGNKPSEGDLKIQLSHDIPAFVKVISFTIEALENQGTEVEPRYRSRFKATVEASDDLCKPDKKENDILFVLMQTPKGKKTDIFGRTTSVLYQGSWKHSIEIDGNPIGNFGIPLNQIPGSRIIVRGSNEEKAYYAEIKLKDDEFRKQIDNAKNILIGTWKDNTSLVTYSSDGSLHAEYDDGHEEILFWEIKGDNLTILWNGGKRKKTRNGPWEEWGNKSQTDTCRLISIDENTYSCMSIDQYGRSGQTWNAKRVKK